MTMLLPTLNTERVADVWALDRSPNLQIDHRTASAPNNFTGLDNEETGHVPIRGKFLLEWPFQRLLATCKECNYHLSCIQLNTF